MRIVIAPDSFKGSISANEAAVIMGAAFQTVFPNADIDRIPLADGGEGTLEALLLATNGHVMPVRAEGPMRLSMDTEYGVMGDGHTAVIEVANICGLPLLNLDERDPLLTSTYGLGTVMRAVMDAGYRRIIVGLGGSATNDGGMGMLTALGVIFRDANGDILTPVGESLEKVFTVDSDGLDQRCWECQWIIASDVRNPLLGLEGATAVFGPQKGASPEALAHLEAGMQNYARRLEDHFGRTCRHQAGAGAAGGLGFAFHLLQGEIRSGAELMAAWTRLEGRIQGADWVITGEGQSDYQTNMGKLPGYVAELASKYNVPTVLISGGLGHGHERLYEHFVSLHTIVRGPTSLSEAMANAKEYLRLTTMDVARLIRRASETNDL